MEREVIITEDGSTSLVIKEWGETFHSIHGAIQESQHVYINAGLSKIKKDHISVLEFGFGTGLNTLLTAKYAETQNKIIYFETIEAFPLTQDEFQLLNYNDKVFANISLQKFHELSWNEKHEVSDYFTFYKHFNKIEDLNVLQKVDIVFFDVFGYDYQPHLWEVSILEKAYNALNNNGVFVTYACKGEVNRRLKSLGFTVYKVPGPPGKREMTFAVKEI